MTKLTHRVIIDGRYLVSSPLERLKSPSCATEELVAQEASADSRSAIRLINAIPENGCYHAALTFDSEMSGPDLEACLKSRQTVLHNLGKSFTKKYPKGWYIWIKEIGKQLSGFHYHLVVSTGDSTEQDDFKIWLRRRWLGLVDSKFKRNVEVTECPPVFGYPFKYSKKFYAGLLCLLKNKHGRTFGIVGKKNFARDRLPCRSFKCNDVQFNLIKYALELEVTQIQQRYRDDGNVNQRHLNNVKSDYISHGFMQNALIDCLIGILDGNITTKNDVEHHAYFTRVAFTTIVN